MEKLKRFTGKVVVITGASRGIGKGIAMRFGLEGAKLVIAANEELIHNAGKELSKAGIEVTSLVVDVTSKKQVQDLYAKAHEKYGRIDVSIHNAGVITIKPLPEMTEEEWDFVMDVNTKGVWLCCQAAANYMLKQKSGKIINTASGQSREGFIYTPHYAASKMGVMGITQSLAKELAPFGITVNAFAPGIISTDMWGYNDREWGKLLGNYKPGELMQEWVDNLPMKRVGTPEDIAGLVTFLASSDADYITGQTINCDGGLSMN